MAIDGPFSTHAEAPFSNSRHLLRERLKHTTIPAARNALDAAKLEVLRGLGNSGLSKSPAELKEAARRIIGASSLVVEVVRGVSHLTEAGQETAVIFESLIQVESSRPIVNHQFAIVIHTISRAMFSMRHLISVESISDDTRENLGHILSRVNITLSDFEQYANMCYQSQSRLAVFRDSTLKGYLQRLYEEFAWYYNELNEFFSIEIQLDIRNDRKYDTYKASLIERAEQIPRGSSLEHVSSLVNGRGEALEEQNPELLSKVPELLIENVIAYVRVALGDRIHMLEDKKCLDIMIGDAARRVYEAVQVPEQDAGKEIKTSTSAPCSHVLFLSNEGSDLASTQTTHTPLRPPSPGLQSPAPPSNKKGGVSASESTPPSVYLSIARSPAATATRRTPMIGTAVVSKDVVAADNSEIDGTTGRYTVGKALDLENKNRKGSHRTTIKVAQCMGDQNSGESSLFDRQSCDQLVKTQIFSRISPPEEICEVTSPHTIRCHEKEPKTPCTAKTTSMLEDFDDVTEISEILLDRHMEVRHRTNDRVFS